MAWINIANFFEADRRSATAGEDMTMGMLVKVSDDGAGGRTVMKLLDADAALLVAGNYGVVYKVSADADQVHTSTASAVTGLREVTVSSGDAVVEVRRGAIVEYSADLLHSSLDAAREGTAPTVNDALEIKSSQWCEVGTGSAITTVVGRVFKVFGTRVAVEIV